MYLVGATHPHKFDAQILLKKLIAGGERLVTDAEVLQEILHRYTGIGRRDAIAPAMNVLLSVVDDVYQIEKADALRAAEIVQGPSQFSARDAIHLAILERYGVKSIFSFDSDFDKWPGLNRFYSV